MKRNILLTIMFAVLVSACTQSLKSKARERYKVHVHNAFDHLYSIVDISDEKVLMSEDSICILQYTVRGEDYSGDDVKLRMEYIIFWSTSAEPKLMEAFYLIDKDSKSLLDNEISFYSISPKLSMPKDKRERLRKLRSFAGFAKMDKLIFVDEE